MPTVVINGKKHTPSSGTLKKMKRKAAMEAATKSDKPKSKKAKAKMEAPTPRPRSERPKKKPVEGLRVPTGPKAMKLKGKVKDLPSRKTGITKGGNTGDKTTKSALVGAANRAYAKKIRGK